ncbi:MAG: hypothetical protein P0Y55_06610 [Candidatus Cohnella colombiensis]|uniref:Zf-HC2 domain-containing protein n=1 Tax=Candidatus Cohnella colombiensis TaxID=3121368 RepID=A0AA95EZC5_9BACL|nr:MAG: hypothetical protein P0Y55_06610 [Cohnella sp.]
MKCEEAEQLFGVYWDLPEDSQDRLAMDEHIVGCSECAEQFKMWEESTALIQELPFEDSQYELPLFKEALNNNVMNRIYAEQAWYMPAVRRTYAFSFEFKRKVASILAALLAIFVSGFLYTLYGSAKSADSQFSGIMETANAFSASQDLSSNIQLNIPVASLSDPILFHVAPAMPQYWVAFSIVGIIMTMLILNWFSRVRS